jgi:hypothetical protein
MTEDKRSQLEKYNDDLISKSVEYAKNINALYRDGIEYHSYPDIPDEKRVPLIPKSKDNDSK